MAASKYNSTFLIHNIGPRLYKYTYMLQNLINFYSEHFLVTLGKGGRLLLVGHG